MLQDISATERAAYAQKIMRKENNIDDLRGLERNFQERNDQFISRTQRYFEASEESFYHLSDVAPGQAQREQEQFQEIQHELESGIENQNETLETSCRSTMRTMENEVEDLHKERNALPW